MKNAASVSAETLTAFETVPDLYLILSPELTILTASNAYLACMLLEREKIREKHVLEVFSDNPALPGAAASAPLRSSLEQVVKYKIPHQMPLLRYDIPLAAGTTAFQERYWLSVNTPVLSAEGELRYIIHKTTDVSSQVQEEQKPAKLPQQTDDELKAPNATEEQALSEVDFQQEMLQAFQDQAPVALSLYTGQNLTIAKANKLMCRIWGREPVEVLGRPLLEALPELKGQDFDQLIRQVYNTGIPYIGKESPARMFRNGRLETNYFNFVYQPLYNAAGKLLGVFNVATEVTELVEARKRVEESERKLLALNQELAAANSAIAASNEELRATNEELLETHEALHNLNRQLEERVTARTEELELAKAGIEAERNRLQQLFMQAATPICILSGADFVYELVNPAYQQLLPNRQLLGNPIFDTALAELSSHALAGYMRQVYTTGQTYISKEDLLPIARYEGGPVEERYFNYTLQARRNEQGIVDGIFIFVLEVTEQVLARKAVEKSVTQLKLITDALPVLIGYLDKEQKYQFANKAYESWFNTKPEHLIGRPVREVVGEKAYQGVKQYIDRALAGERLDFESKMPYREDFVKYISTSFVPDFRKGQLKGFYTLVTDVTEQVEARNAVEQSELQARAMAEELRLANELLTRTNIDLDNFIYTASHDLKAPISNIEGLMNVLTDSLPAEVQNSDEISGIILMINESISRFKRTIDHLTEVIKLQKENNQEPALIDLADVINEVQLDFATQLAAAKARLEVDVAACPGVNFSAKNLRSIVYNLVSNALKYASPARTPVIKISCEAVAKYIVLKVKDNGLGMDLSGNPKLFTMFSRLHDHVEGSGIGLYMVKKIVENAGGHIEVDSEVGKGTTFKVYFSN